MTSTVGAHAWLKPAAPIRPIGDNIDRSAGLLLRPVGEVRYPLASVIGIPFDTTTLGRRGAAQGPTAIRDAIAKCLSYNANWDVDLASGPGVVDLGDIDVVSTDVETTWERISEVARDTYLEGGPVVVFGGDHGCTFPVLRGIASAHRGRLGVMNVDAHFDVRDTAHLSAGVPFRLMLERLNETFTGSNFIEFGSGGWSNSAVYRDYLRDQGAHIVSCRDVQRGNLVDLIESSFALMAGGTQGMWLSIDVDAIDASQVPGTAAPAIGGLSTWQVLEVVWAFGRRPDVVGMDIMEVSPPFDPDGASAAVAASLFLTFLAARQSMKA